MKTLKLVGASLLLSVVGLTASGLAFTRAAQAAPWAGNFASGTLVQLREVTAAALVSKPVTFSLAGSHVAKGRDLRSLTIRFGDGTHARLASLLALPQHTYRRPGAFVAEVVLTDSTGDTSTASRMVIVGAPNHVVLRKTTTKLPGSVLTGFESLRARGAIR